LCEFSGIGSNSGDGIRGDLEEMARKELDSAKKTSYVI
jgi:hypothetical protein